MHLDADIALVEMIVEDMLFVEQVIAAVQYNVEDYKFELGLYLTVMVVRVEKQVDETNSHILVLNFAINMSLYFVFLPLSYFFQAWYPSFQMGNMLIIPISFDTSLSC